VLTTLVEQGAYPDPYWGLNNLAIPESLNKQDYWYRTEFSLPPGFSGRELRLQFKGINYFARVWVNGNYLGHITGAFIRGEFDVTPFVRSESPMPWPFWCRLLPTPVSRTSSRSKAGPEITGEC